MNHHLRNIFAASILSVTGATLLIAPARAQDAAPAPSNATLSLRAVRPSSSFGRGGRPLGRRSEGVRLSQQMPGMNHGDMGGMAMPTTPAPTTTPAPSDSATQSASGAAARGSGGEGGRTLDNLSPEQEYPPPVADQQKFSFLLFERLEYGAGNLHWDILGWHGGDRRRTWFKSEGDQSTRGGGFEGDVQLLRGKLISSYFDLQYGVRFEAQRDNGSTRGRTFAVVGLQGLAPYRYEIEPALFIDQSGNISGRFTASYDLLLSQKLILQPRFETNFALQEVERFGVGRGLNDAEVALLLRYEIRREFAPYIGLTYGRSFGGTANFLRREGEDPGRFKVVAGVRMWF